MGGFRRGGQRRMLWAVVASLAIHATVIVGFALREPEPPVEARGGHGVAASITLGRGAVDGDDSTRAKPRESENQRVADEESIPAVRPDNAGDRSVTQESKSVETELEPAARLGAVEEGTGGTSESKTDSAVGAVFSSGGSGGDFSRGGSSVSNGVAVLIEPPRPLERIVPEYPRIARRRGLEGEVVIQVTISVSGDPLTATVISPSDHRVLNDAAIAAVQSARFQPGRVGDQPAEMSLSIRIVFELS